MPMPNEYQRAGEIFDRFLEDACIALDLTTRNQPYTTVQGVLLAFRRRLTVAEGLRFADALPAVLRKLAERARASPLALGPLRDVTINRRRDGYFRLDPHLDPAADGPNVCIVGLLSDTVLTLSKVGPPDSTTCDQEAVSMHSWDPADVDVLATIGTLVHLSGKARTELHHGIRLGVSRRQLSEAGVDVDGDEQDLVRQNDAVIVDR